MAKMLLFRVGEKSIQVNVNKLKDFYKYLECDCIDAVTITSDERGRLTLWVDDDGLLVNKPRNRGYSGHIIASRCDLSGEDVDLTEEDIVKIENYFKETEIKSSSKIIQNFVDAYDGESFTFDYSYDNQIFMQIGASSNDVLTMFTSITDLENIKTIEITITHLYMGRISENDFFEMYAHSIADHRHRILLNQYK